MKSDIGENRLPAPAFPEDQGRQFPVQKVVQKMVLQAQRGRGPLQALQVFLNASRAERAVACGRALPGMIDQAQSFVQLLV